MPEPDRENPFETIHITREEATSSHVDDLLKRQASLRGETGITRDRRRHWWYQNWFVFMIAGLCGAVGAWAIIEPFFDDRVYLQGTIEAVDPTAQLSLGSNITLFAKSPTLGTIEIKQQKIHLLKGIRELKPDGSKAKLKPESLQKGEKVGVYLDSENVGDEELYFAIYLVRSPPEQSPAREKLTLSQLRLQNTLASLMLFPLVAGLIGLAIGSADGQSDESRDEREQHQT